MDTHAAEEEKGLPEWVMSYADMITILMAFFVVMFSMAGNKDNPKELAVLQALRNQFGPVTPEWGPNGQNSSGAQFELPFKGGTKRKDKNRGGVDLHRVNDGDYTRVHAPVPGEQSRIGGVISFSGQDVDLSEPQEKTIARIAEEVGGKPQKIEIRGHTGRPAKGQTAEQDAWDLAYARCRSVMEELVALGIDPKRIRLGVAGENEPLTDSGVAPAYAQNSRVEVFLLDEVAPQKKS